MLTLHFGNCNLQQNNRTKRFFPTVINYNNRHNNPSLGADDSRHIFCQYNLICQQ